MYYTDREKAAIVVLSGVIACADDKLAKEEQEMGRAIAVIIGVTESCHTLTQSMKPTEAMDVVAAMTSEEKRFVCAALATMIAIDGDVDDKETFLWSLISERCKLPEMTIAQGVEIFKGYL